jgi:hypothetical protein
LVWGERILAAEHLGGDAAAEAGAVVGDDGDRCRHLAQDVLVGVDDVHQPAVVAQVVQAGDPFGLGDRGVQAGDGVLGAAGRADGDGQAVFGGVVDHRADPPGPASGGFELGEVGLPDPVPGGRRAWTTFLRSSAHDFRSARNPVGSSRPSLMLDRAAESSFGTDSSLGRAGSTKARSSTLLEI